MKKQKKKEKKEKHENIMKELPCSAFSCAAHSEDYLRMKPYGSKSAPTCKSCGVKVEGQLGYLVCPKNANCYFLCSACKVCSNNHMLRNVVSLKQYTSELYEKNRFVCHGCKKEKEVQERGVWHCGPCSFTICVECMDRTQAMWNNQGKYGEK